MELTDRGRRCSKLFDLQFDFICTLPLDHGGEDHEDHVTDAPCIVAWRKRELIDPADIARELALVGLSPL